MQSMQIICNITQNGVPHGLSNEEGWKSQDMFLITSKSEEAVKREKFILPIDWG